MYLNFIVIGSLRSDTDCHYLIFKDVVDAVVLQTHLSSYWSNCLDLRLVSDPTTS